MLPLAPSVPAAVRRSRDRLDDSGCHELFQVGRRRAGYLLLVEHDPPVITVSRRKGARQHLTATEAQLQAAGVVVAETDRLHRRRPVRTSDRSHLHLEAFEIGDFENEKREKVGLPPRHVPPDSVRKLLEATGLIDTLSKAKPRKGGEG